MATWANPRCCLGGFSVDSALANGTTDWQDLTTGTGVKQEYDLSMTQGTEKFKTYVNLSAMNNQSYLLGNSYRRYTGRVNIDWNILKKLKLGVSASGAYGRNNKIGQAWDGSLGMAQSNALPYFNEETSNSAFGGANRSTAALRLTGAASRNAASTPLICNIPRSRI